MTIAGIKASSKAVLSVNEAAEILECDPRTVSRALDAGTIPSIPVGRRRMIPTAPFLKLLGIEI